MQASYGEESPKILHMWPSYVEGSSPLSLKGVEDRIGRELGRPTCEVVSIGKGA